MLKPNNKLLVLLNGPNHKSPERFGVLRQNHDYHKHKRDAGKQDDIIQRALPGCLRCPESHNTIHRYWPACSAPNAATGSDATYLRTKTWPKDETPW